MKIIIYAAVEGQDVLGKWLYAARIETGGDFLPVTLHGPTEEAVTEKAQSFWDDELTKTHAKHANTIKRTEARKAKRAVKADGQTVEEDTDDVAI